MNGGNERERPRSETAQEAHKQCPLQSFSCSQMAKYQCFYKLKINMLIIEHEYEHVLVIHFRLKLFYMYYYEWKKKD